MPPLIPPDPSGVDWPPVGGHTDEVIANNQRGTTTQTNALRRSGETKYFGFSPLIREILVLDGYLLPSFFIDNYAEDESTPLNQHCLYYEAHIFRHQRDSFQKAVTTYKADSQATGVFLEIFPNTGNVIMATFFKISLLRTEPCSTRSREHLRQNLAPRSRRLQR